MKNINISLVGPTPVMCFVSSIQFPLMGPSRKKYTSGIREGDESSKQGGVASVEKELSGTSAKRSKSGPKICNFTLFYH